MAKTIQELDSYSLEEIASRVRNEIDLQSLVLVFSDIRSIPSFRKRLEKRECIDKWCNFISNSLLKLYRHNRNNHQKIRCNLCSPVMFPFNGMYHLRAHQNIVHTVAKGFKCVNCNKQYYWKCSLNQHRRSCNLID